MTTLLCEAVALTAKQMEKLLSIPQRTVIPLYKTVDKIAKVSCSEFPNNCR